MEDVTAVQDKTRKNIVQFPRNRKPPIEVVLY